ncbi:MAG: ABC transporter ATP-binding protein [Planctomycetes bacterium]|nr:ABC transporter ATP-binding protein [Planctomycetota bacterium]
MPPILETQGLSRSFGRIRAVQDLNLRLEEGDIYGFLGLNGAGKTTTIRMCLGLIRPHAGRVRVFGKDLRESFITIMRGVGSLVELPAYYPHLSGRRNLEILRVLTPGVPASRIDEVLETVGLGDRKDSAVRTYSQGMRQRLGIAMALLPDPRLVILDEPTNGLDPHGINHIRGVIREQNRTKGVTFLISSHLLHEVEITCTRVGIIKEGRLIDEGPLEKILSQTAGAVRIEAEPLDRALEVVRGRPYVQGVAESGDGEIVVRMDPAHRADLNEELVKAGVRVSGFVPDRATLEEYFLSK